MLPLVITCAVAYAVRKAIMDESIYTMKLRARRHLVPEGLRAAAIQGRRIADVMETDFAVVPVGGNAPIGIAFAVHSAGGAVSGVTRRASTGSVSSDAAPAPSSLRYALVNDREMLSTAIQTLADGEVDLILASHDPNARRAEDVVGLVTPATIARLLRAEDGLA